MLCQLCTLSENNLMGFDSGSDEEAKFDGGGMNLEARVSFDPQSKNVVGWESIWAIIDGEEQ